MGGLESKRKEGRKVVKRGAEERAGKKSFSCPQKWEGSFKRSSALPNPDGPQVRILVFFTLNFLIPSAVYLTIEWIVKAGKSMEAVD